MQRGFQHKQKKKYWEIECRGAEQLVRTSKLDSFWGLSSQYKSKYKRFDSPEKANVDSEKKIAKTLEGGFEELAKLHERSIPKKLDISAEQANDVFLVRQMIEAGWEVTPNELTKLAGGGSIDVVKVLQGQGHALPPDAIISASLTGKDDLVAILLDAGIDPDTSDATGDSALMLASQKGKLKVVTRLLDAGADPNARNKRGSTATFHAVIDGRRDVLEELVAGGADISLKNRDDRTALDAGAAWLEKSGGKERERILETCRWLAQQGSPSSEATRGALVTAGIEVPGEAPMLDESKRQEVLGEWRLHKIVYYASRDDSRHWYGPETLSLTGGEEGRLVFHDDGTLEYKRWGNDKRGAWTIHGRNIKADISRPEHHLELAANGKSLKFHMYDEEHGAPYAEVYVR